MHSTCSAPVARVRRAFGVALGLTLTACAGEPDETQSVDRGSSALRCFNPEGCPQPSTCAQATGSLTASASTIHQGETATLSWSANVPDGCGEQLLLDGVVVAPSGSKTVTPLASGGHVLRVGSKRLAGARVNVILPNVVYIDGNTGDWPALLVQAVGTPFSRVVLGPDIDMDLSGYQNIAVAEGVTLTSEAPPPKGNGAGDGNGLGHSGAVGTAGGLATAAVARTVHVGFGPQPPLRDGLHLGPRLFTTSRPTSGAKALLYVSCRAGNFASNNIHILGFRLEGPDFDTMEGDDKLERAIAIDSCLGVEVADMEISGWSGAAVFVSDSWSRQFAPETVRIHDNFIHHNQHSGGDGYGVDIGPGGYASVERNVFDWNRHAVTSSGSAGSGYLADRNLILKGGGNHDKFLKATTHIMDVHGDNNCIPGTAHVFDCGNAGEQFWMTNNAFQFTKNYDIKVRGTPRIKAIIGGNVFPQDRDDAIGWSLVEGDTNIKVDPNTYGVDTFGEYGVCDIDGDGKDDLFLATGASWWYMSAAKRHWVYLSPHQERLSQVLLGDFNGDHRCDVVAKNTSTNALEITSGGTGDWSVYATGFADIPFEELRPGDFNGDGITDIFRRAPDGQWWAMSPGYYNWTPLQSSSTPLVDLRLGDFNGDGFTDVLGTNDGGWAISWSAQSTWQPTGSGLSADLRSVFIANVDGLPGDDVVRYKEVSANTGRWDVSSGARTGWTTLATHTWPSFGIPAWTGCEAVPARCARTYLGKFDEFAGADVLALDVNPRTSRIFSKGHTAFAEHGLYSY